ncbi:hypothetical protein [Rhizobacter sp. OV335]|uniref:hypothetical protein n=1 Tax=Rhizobacter sp. OV335 TaxID=1500264 RepID=UPI0011614099|nr:hypothetical protein [Rhizobacter sp. OV335]
MAMKMRQTCLRALLAMLPCLASATTGAVADDCDAVTPKELASALASRYADWKPLRLSDLPEDDQALWLKVHGTGCPGLARGNFTGTHGLQFGVLLWQEEPRRQLQLLFAEQDATGHYRFTRILYQRVDRLSVVFVSPPGHYRRHDHRGAPVHVTSDAIIMETIEAGTTAFYMTRGKFRTIAISD